MNAAMETGTPKRSMIDRVLHLRSLAIVAPLFVVALFLVSSFAPGVTSPLQSMAPGISAAAAGHATTGVPPTVANSLAAGLSASPKTGGGGSSYIENGSGTFFNDSAVANVTTGHASCATYPLLSFIHECWNATADPTLNLTSTGTTGMAYTIWTNDSPCASMPNATTEIGFVNSSDFGNTWGTPQVLGNPVCATDSSDDQNYSDAEMPALTSLANGTFVLAYVESNDSTHNFYYYDAAYPMNIGCYYTAHDRIVVTESYDSGATWTIPTVVQQNDINYTSSYDCGNPGSSLVRPSITAIGNTVYLAYTDYSCEFLDCYNSSIGFVGTLHLAVSTNGGGSWTQSNAPPRWDVYVSVEGLESSIAAFPNILVTPSGTLYMSYASGYDYIESCGLTFCEYNENATLVVAWSTNNGTSFTTSTVSENVGVENYYEYNGEYLTGPWSQLAYNPDNGQLYVVFANAIFGTYCYYYYTGGNYCDDEISVTDSYFANSSNGGVTWSTPTSIDPGSLTSGGPMNSAFMPALAALPDGQVDITYSSTNASVCTAYSIYSYYCGVAQQMFTYTDNNGSTFAQPALVDDTYFDAGCPPCEGYGNEVFLGVSSDVIAAGGQVLLAWPNINGSSIYHYAYWGGYGSVNVETSRLYTGAGITASFKESGLPTSSNWSATIGGYFRDGPAGSTLSLSGVPPGYSLSFDIPWVNTSYGVAWQPTPSSSSPVVLSKSGSVTVTFSELILVNLATLPALESYYWSGYTNYAISSLPGQYWMVSGTPFTVTLSPTTATFCYPCVNLTFVTWVGTGNGSYSGGGLTLTITPTGPVNETATFSVNGWCYVYIKPSCYTYAFTQAFVESGLPGGTSWGVSLSSNGTISSLTSSTNIITDNIPVGISTFVAWTVPSSIAGEFWVPSSTSPASFTEPNLPILINYTLAVLTNTPVDSWVTETGLPNDTAWNFQVGGLSTGTSIASDFTEIEAGSASTLNASSVYFEDGDGYQLNSITVDPLVMNQSVYTVLPGGSTTFDGPAVLTFNFAPIYLVTTSASIGGNVSEATQWVGSGVSLAITAMPSTGYHFVSWTGSGAGSTSSGVLTTIVVKPLSPVMEFATFRANFNVTWNVTLQAAGLPAATSFSIDLGGITYSSPVTLKIGNFSTGDYNLSAPTIFANASNTTQFVPISVTSSAGLSNGVLDLDTNVTVTVTYETQYALSVFATPGGSITGYPSGTYWENAGTSVSLTAVPSTGDYLAGWSGTVSSTSTTISVPITGISNETAQFLVRPIPPPAVYSLTVDETGLPANTAWAVSVGTAGSSGTTSSLTVPGLNGTYSITATTLYPSTGIRWVSSETNVSTPVVQNGTITVTYYEQFQVAVIGTAGGTAGTSAPSGWTNASATVTLTATPNSTSQFVAWNGTGTGSYSGTSATTTVTVTGPITEQATFAPIPAVVQPNKTSNANTNGETVTILVLVALLVAGLVVGLLVGRRRSPPASGSSAPQAWSGPEAPADDSAAAPTDEPAAAIYDEGTPPS